MHDSEIKVTVGFNALRDLDEFIPTLPTVTFWLIPFHDYSADPHSLPCMFSTARSKVQGVVVSRALKTLLWCLSEGSPSPSL